MLDWLYRLFGSMLSFFEGMFGEFGNYAIALFLYALVIKILFLPFSIKQQKNQIAMAKLAPKIALIRAKYKGRTDQVTMQKQQEEIMELQKQEGYSMLSGCLPLLIQMPIIMLLYTVIQNPLSYMTKTTDQVELFNDAIESGNYEELLDEELGEEFLKHYGTFAEDGKYTTEFKEFKLDNAIVSLYNELNGYNSDDKNYADEVKDTKSKQINTIKLINAFIEDKDGSIVEKYPTLDSKEKRIEYIESFGIEYDSIPNFSVFGLNLAETPSIKKFSVLLLIPLLVAVSQWVSVWAVRKFNGSSNPAAGGTDAQAQASTKIMEFAMPLMTLFFAFQVPAVLGVYWIFQSLLGMLQSFILSKAMPLPKYTEEEIKDMNKKAKEIEKAQAKAAKSQPKYRSYHYIDEDDYEELPELPETNEKKDKNDFNGDMPEIKD